MDSGNQWGPPAGPLFPGMRLSDPYGQLPLPAPSPNFRILENVPRRHNPYTDHSLKVTSRSGSRVGGKEHPSPTVSQCDVSSQAHRQTRPFNDTPTASTVDQMSAQEGVLCATASNAQRAALHGLMAMQKDRPRSFDAKHTASAPGHSNHGSALTLGASLQSPASTPAPAGPSRPWSRVSAAMRSMQTAFGTVASIAAASARLQPNPAEAQHLIESAHHAFLEAVAEAGEAQAELQADPELDAMHRLPGHVFLHVSRNGTILRAHGAALEVLQTLGGNLHGQSLLSLFETTGTTFNQLAGAFGPHSHPHHPVQGALRLRTPPRRWADARQRPPFEPPAAQAVDVMFTGLWTASPGADAAPWMLACVRCADDTTPPAWTSWGAPPPPLHEHVRLTSLLGHYGAPPDAAFWSQQEVARGAHLQHDLLPASEHAQSQFAVVNDAHGLGPSMELQ
ncbi:unnamed protein product [Pedinophyceae sp. YPF-701]|nr:unnamed protein product [Pedinophyceae sp. YPF-701]